MADFRPVDRHGNPLQAQPDAPPFYDPRLGRERHMTRKEYEKVWNGGEPIPDAEWHQFVEGWHRTLTHGEMPMSRLDRAGAQTASLDEIPLPSGLANYLPIPDTPQAQSGEISGSGATAQATLPGQGGAGFNIPATAAQATIQPPGWLDQYLEAVGGAPARSTYTPGFLQGSPGDPGTGSPLDLPWRFYAPGYRMEGKGMGLQGSLDGGAQYAGGPPQNWSRLQQNLPPQRAAGSPYEGLMSLAATNRFPGVPSEYMRAARAATPSGGPPSLVGSRYDAGPNASFVPEGPNLNPRDPGGRLYTPTRQVALSPPSSLNQFSRDPGSIYQSFGPDRGPLPQIDVGGVKAMTNAGRGAVDWALAASDALQSVPSRIADFFGGTPTAAQTVSSGSSNVDPGYSPVLTPHVPTGYGPGGGYGGGYIPTPSWSPTPNTPSPAPAPQVASAEVIDPSGGNFPSSALPASWSSPGGVPQASGYGGYTPAVYSGDRVVVAAGDLGGPGPLAAGDPPPGSVAATDPNDMSVVDDPRIYPDKGPAQPSAVAARGVIGPVPYQRPRTFTQKVAVGGASMLGNALVPGLGLLINAIGNSMTRGTLDNARQYTGGPVTSYNRTGTSPWGSAIYTTPTGGQSASMFTPSGSGWHAPNFNTSSGGNLYAYNPETHTYIDSSGREHPY